MFKASFLFSRLVLFVLATFSFAGLSLSQQGASRSSTPTASPNDTSDIPIGNTGLQCQSPPLDIMRLLPSGATVTLTCPDGYDLVGAYSTMCDFSGLWSTNGIGYCKYRKVKCEPPEIPQHASVLDQTTTNNDFLVGNYIQFGCDTGYDLVGNAIIRCSKGSSRSNRGEWSSVLPKCRRNDATPPTVKTTCNEPRYIPENAHVKEKKLDLGNNTFGIGGSITYDCNFCYSLSGIKSINCTTGGTWQPNETPICVHTKFGYYLVNSTLVKCGGTR